MAISGKGCVGDGGAARVGKAEDFGDFVETFTDSVVAGGADNFEVIVRGGVEDLGVSAGNDKREEGEARSSFVEPSGVEMAFEVVNWIERLIMENGESAGGEGADEERAEKARGVSDGNSGDVGPSFIGVF